MSVSAIEWVGGLDGKARLLDQTLLPLEERYLDCGELEQVWEAIRALRVRGAPAIGIAAAMAAVLAIRNSSASNYDEFAAELRRATGRLEQSRPTAINLFWALRRMEEAAAANRDTPIPQLKERLLAEARAILAEDREMCRAIGEHGARLMPRHGGVLTHCNAGALATGGAGTALAVIKAARRGGKDIHVFADETRPLLQGARLTVWELMREGTPVTLICDNAAAWVMQQGKAQAVIVGADRIAANGDAANKIGTYGLAVLARAHRIPFYIAAPSSSFDLSLADGGMIPIEERGAEEVTCGFGRRTAPNGAVVFSPAFDVTPARLIDAIVTERGIIERPNRKSIAGMLE